LLQKRKAVHFQTVIGAVFALTVSPR